MFEGVLFVPTSIADKHSLIFDTILPSLLINFNILVFFSLLFHDYISVDTNK